MYSVWVRLHRLAVYSHGRRSSSRKFSLLVPEPDNALYKRIREAYNLNYVMLDIDKYAKIIT